MSLLVSNNPDGTVTVTCGSDAVTIGTPASSPSISSSDPTLWPPITPGGGGVTASFRTKKQAFTLKSKAVTSTQEIIATLRQQAPGNAESPVEDPLVLRFIWSSDEPLDMSGINEAIRDLEDQVTLRCEIVFWEDHNE